MFHLKPNFGFRHVNVKASFVWEIINEWEHLCAKVNMANRSCIAVVESTGPCAYMYIHIQYTLTHSQTIYHCWRKETHLLSLLVGVNLSTDSRRRLHHTFVVYIGCVCVRLRWKNKEKERGKGWLGGASVWVFVPHSLQTNYSFLPDLSQMNNFFHLGLQTVTQLKITSSSCTHLQDHDITEVEFEMSLYSDKMELKMF